MASANGGRPERAGRFVIFEEIGRGGMGRVELACLLGGHGFSKLVALKRAFGALEEATAGLVKEAKLAARLSHPNVVQTFDVESVGGSVMIAMDHVLGASLAELRRDGEALGESRPPINVTLAVMIDVLSGLAAAHENSEGDGRALPIVHRDVTPHNILVGVDGISRLADFGIARFQGPHLTTEGVIRGKIAYLAPEVIRGEPPTPSSDLFSVSVVFWELLTGTRCFGDRTIDALARDYTPRPPNAFAEDVPPEVSAVVLRGMLHDPTDRFATAREMLVAVERCGVVAARSDVTAWVEHVAQPRLAKRRAQISRALSYIAELPNDDAVTVTEPQTAERRRPPRWPAVLGGAALLLVLGVVLARSIGAGSVHAPSPTRAEPVPPATSTTLPLSSNEAAVVPSASSAPDRVGARKVGTSHNAPRKSQPQPKAASSGCVAYSDEAGRVHYACP